MTETCRLCGSQSNFAMTAVIMKKHTISYFDCSNCGYVQTESPFWLKESYEIPINNLDTGLLTRNYQNSLLIYFLLILIFGKKYKTIRHLDYAGGYGVLVGLLREFKINSFWHDKYCSNLFAKDFEWDQNKYEAEIVSAFEVFEHFENPNVEIENLLTYSTSILFTTRLISNNIPKVHDWWYYGEAHGQHIGFYRYKTLVYLAKKYDLKLLTDGVAIHLLTRKNISSVLFKLASRYSKITILNLLKKL